MKKILWALPMLVLFAALARAGKGSCGACPSKVGGAQTVVENTADGVAVHITAKDPAAIKKIQESAAEHFKKDASGKCADCKKGKPCAKCAAKHAHKAGWACPMGCTHSDKPGKCPKCGMDMKPEGEKSAKP
ncbi:MAG: heavy metal-binding domain-containing protein [Elusimicrobiota bacterium]